MPTLSVISMYWCSAGHWIQFIYADHTQSECFDLEVAALNLRDDDAAWLALRKAMLTPDTWTQVEN